MFYIFERRPQDVSRYKETVLLIKDHWDDWFKFETQFFMSYVDSMGLLHEIGAVKIGQENMIKGQRSPDIGALTREVFGLEVRQSGFHKILCDEVDKGHSYDEIKELFHGELGDEALALLRTLIMLRDRDEI